MKPALVISTAGYKLSVVQGLLVSPSSESDMILITHWRLHHQQLIWSGADDTLMPPSWRSDLILMAYSCSQYEDLISCRLQTDVPIIRIWSNVDDTLMSPPSGYVVLMAHSCPHHQDLMWYWWHFDVQIFRICDIDGSFVSLSSGPDVILMTHWCHHHQDPMWPLRCNLLTTDSGDRENADEICRVVMCR
jgi:hypothetical protein